MFHWTFSDGTSSDEQNPAHTYTAAGNYTVKLTVTDADNIVVSDTTWASIQGSSQPSEHTGRYWSFQRENQRELQFFCDLNRP